MNTFLPYLLFGTTRFMQKKKHARHKHGSFFLLQYQKPHYDNTFIDSRHCNFNAITMKNTLDGLFSYRICIKICAGFIWRHMVSDYCTEYLTHTFIISILLEKENCLRKRKQVIERGTEMYFYFFYSEKKSCLASGRQTRKAKRHGTDGK